MKKALAIILALVLVLGLTACGSSGSSGGGKTEEAADTVKLGVCLIQSGDFAFALDYQKPAIDMVINMYNEAGGINGKKIEVVYADDQGDSSLVPQRLSELKAAGVSAICGPLFDTTAPAAAEWAAKNEVPVILTCNAPTSITIDQFSDYIYVTGLCAWAEARVLEQFVIDKGIKSVYFIDADGDVPADIYNFFWKEIGQYAEVENKGLTIVGMTETDYTNIITAALNSGAECIAYPVNGGMYTAFQQQADQLGAYEKTYMFGFGNIDLGALQPFGKDYFANSWGYCTTYLDEQGPMGTFTSEYLKLNSSGTYPNELSIHWYNAIAAALEAIKAAGDDTSPANVAKQLTKVTWTTPDGETASFNTWDHLLAAPLNYAEAVYDESLGFWVPQATIVDPDFVFYTEAEFEAYKAQR